MQFFLQLPAQDDAKRHDKERNWQKICSAFHSNKINYCCEKLTVLNLQRTQNNVNIERLYERKSLFIPRKFKIVGFGKYLDALCAEEIPRILERF